MICPICKEYDLVPIWYGEPGLDEIMLSRADMLVLGGPIRKQYTDYCHFCQETYPVIED